MPKTKKYSTGFYGMSAHAYQNFCKAREWEFLKGEVLKSPITQTPFAQISDEQYPLPKYAKPDNKKKLVFVTLNFDETKVTPLGTVKLVKDILFHSSVEKGFAYWEWRKNDPIHLAHGLHCHLVLMGPQTKRIVERCKRCSVGAPYIKLCKDFGTLLKYPERYYSDKVNYCFETNSTRKSEQKTHNVDLRKKFNLPNLTK
ncbi:MAG: putative replicase [Circoviridae sp.]|nr:MAG: putative replicase [Circoviridae sp.]